jgi:hypothetical protein
VPGGVVVVVVVLELVVVDVVVAAEVVVAGSVVAGGVVELVVTSVPRVVGPLELFDPHAAPVMMSATTPAIRTRGDAM